VLQTSGGDRTFVPGANLGPTIPGWSPGEVAVGDPSSLQGYAVDAEGTVTEETVERVGISVAGGAEVAVTDGYSWEPWTVVGWQDRAKAGIEVLADQLWAVVEG